MTCREVSINIAQPKPSDMQPSGGRVYIPLSGKIESVSRSMQAGNRSIYRVHIHLRDINKKAYEPEIIAIGPYHHGKEKLAMMEEHKVRYLHNLLHDKRENVGRYIEAIRQHEEKVRNFYAEPLSSLASDELVEMMVLDGCFIIQLVRKYHLPNLRDENDPVFKMDWMRNSLLRDLMLFENQLPFFLLHELFCMVEVPDENQLLLNFFHLILPDPMRRWRNWSDEYPLREVKHLLDFVHINWLPPPFQRVLEIQNSESDSDRKNLFRLNWFRSDEEIPNNESDSNKKSLIMRSATKLREAGVKFKKVEGHHFFDISFTNRTLKIPTLHIDDSTEAFLRNLIAHEQYIGGTSQEMFVTEYTRFMDCLINSSEDVEILRHHGIIDNSLGDDEVVSDMFNKITDSVTGPILADGRYADVLKELNSHCNKRRNRWMVILRNNVFNSPWAIISVVAAAILLILTATQTKFTVFPRS